MSKSVAAAHASINQFVSPAKERLAALKVKHDLQVSVWNVNIKSAANDPPDIHLIDQRRAKQTNRDIGSKSRMRSLLHLLSFLVLLAVLSSSMGDHKPDHDTQTIAPMKDLRGKRLRRSLGETTSVRCPSNCCRKCREMPKKCRECSKKRFNGCSRGKFCVYNIDPARPYSDSISISDLIE